MGRGTEYAYADLDEDDMCAVLESRDVSFAGVFFVGVAPTGIYCRPGCTAKVPMRGNCHLGLPLFASAKEAETAGFRACELCRPERLKEGS